MSSEKSLYFDIEKMTCSSCTATIENGLLAEKFVKEVNINLATHCARVVVDIDIDPKTVESKIDEVGFAAKWINPRNEKTFYFAIRGMASGKDADKIKNALSSKKAYIKSCEVDYSTNTATIVTCGAYNTKETQALSNRLKRDIQSVKLGSDFTARCTAKQVQPPINEKDGKDNPEQYFRKARINALIGLPLFIFGNFIPLPITLLGQAIGAAVGGAVLWAMWETGREFYQGAWRDLLNKRSSNMNTLIALGTGSAWVYSMVLVFGAALFPIAALQYQFIAVNMILGIINFGRGIRAYAQEQTKRKVQNLAQVYVSLQPQIVKKLTLKNSPGLFKRSDLDKHLVQTNYLDIVEGDIIQVKRDERFLDGTIISCGPDGTMVRQETLTGESNPCNKKRGDEVYSGSLNTKNTVYIRATKNGPEGRLTKMIEDVAKSSASKPSISKLVDKLAVIVVPATISISALTGLGWFLLGPVPTLPFVIKSSLSVLMIVCPCALGLATPISIALAIHYLFNKGVFVHDATVLESAAQVDTVVFDKTNTLTRLKVALEHFFVSKNSTFNKKQILQKVASLEKACIKEGFDHPIARSFVTNNSLNSYVNLSPCTDVKKEQQGVSGFIRGESIIVGSLSHLENKGIKVPAIYKRHENRHDKLGMSSVYVAIGKKCVAVLGLKHEICEGAAQCVDDLKKMNIDVYMLTGDQKAPAYDVANKLGIKKVVTGKDSNMKEQFVADLQKRGRTVLMAGDGVNDLKALRKADVGVAVGSWTDASSAAHVAVQKLDIVPFIIIAKQTMRNIYQNLWWTCIYNLISLTAATGLLYPLFGFAFNPVVASVAMAFSSICVVLNSSRLTYLIDYEVAVYEKKIAQPTTFFQKLKHFLPINTLVQTVKGLVSFNNKNQDELAKQFEKPKPARTRVPQFDMREATNNFPDISSNSQDEDDPEVAFIGMRRRGFR